MIVCSRLSIIIAMTILFVCSVYILTPYSKSYSTWVNKSNNPQIRHFHKSYQNVASCSSSLVLTFRRMNNLMWRSSRSSLAPQAVRGHLGIHKTWTHTKQNKQNIEGPAQQWKRTHHNHTGWVSSQGTGYAYYIQYGAKDGLGARAHRPIAPGRLLDEGPAKEVGGRHAGKGEGPPQEAWQRWTCERKKVNNVKGMTVKYQRSYPLKPQAPFPRST